MVDDSCFLSLSERQEVRDSHPLEARSQQCRPVLPRVPTTYVPEHPVVLPRAQHEQVEPKAVTGTLTGDAGVPEGSLAS